METALKFAQHLDGIPGMIEDSKTRTVTLRLDVSLVASLDALGEIGEMSRNTVCSYLLEAGLEATLKHIHVSETLEEFKALQESHLRQYIEKESK